MQSYITNLFTKSNEMKLFIVFVIIAFNIFSSIAQVKIIFNEPPLYTREKAGQQPTYSGTYNDYGYLLINKRSSTVTLVSEKNQECKEYELTKFKPVEGVGHYLSFGINVEGSVFNFIPEDNLLIFGYKPNHLIALELTNKQRDDLLKEMRR